MTVVTIPPGLQTASMCWAHISRITSGLLDELATNDEHTARAAGGIIDAQARSRLDKAHHEADDITRRVEVAALLARRFGKHVDQEFICRTQQVRKLKILIAQAVAVEVAHQVLARVIRDDALIADRAHEANVVEDVFERLVRITQCAEGFIEHTTKKLGRIVDARLQIGPAGTLGDKETIVKI